MFRLITAQSAAFTQAKKKKEKGIFTLCLIPLCSLPLARRAYVLCRFPNSLFWRRRAQGYSPKVRDRGGGKKHRGDALCRRFISVCLCMPEESVGAESTRSLSPPHPTTAAASPYPCTRISCFLPLICHPLRSARRQPGGRATGGRATGAELITGGSRTDRETDRKDEAVWNNCAMEAKPT